MAQTVCEPRIAIYNRAKFKSQKHLHQTTFETLKNLQQTKFWNFCQKVAKNAPFLWATSSLQKSQSGHPVGIPIIFFLRIEPTTNRYKISAIGSTKCEGNFWTCKFVQKHLFQNHSVDLTCGRLCSNSKDGFAISNGILNHFHPTAILVVEVNS